MHKSWHAKCGFERYACDFDTKECGSNTHECDFYTQSVVSTPIVILTRTNVISKRSYKSDFYTQSVIIIMIYFCLVRKKNYLSKFMANYRKFFLMIFY
jgi:hypothetical protein